MLIKLLVLSTLVIAQNLLADTEITVSAGSFNYDLTTSEELTGDGVKLYDTYFSAQLESSSGIFSLDKTTGGYEDKNFDGFNYKSSPLMFKIGNPLSILYLPTIDVKRYSEPSREFSENTISTWLGILSYSTRDDQVNSINVKSTRYGLTTSKFVEEFRSLYEYSAKNLDIVETYIETSQSDSSSFSLDENGCHTYFAYVAGSHYCERDNYYYFLYYGLSGDYYKIDVDHQELGSGSGNGFTYGIYALGIARYEIFNNNFIGIGADISNFQGRESVDFSSSQETIRDDISRRNINVTLEYTSRF